MTEHYHQLKFEGSDWESPKTKEEKSKLNIYTLCKEHTSILLSHPTGEIQCYEGGELIEDESQVIQTVGGFAPFEINDMHEASFPEIIGSYMEEPDMDAPEPPDLWESEFPT